jgi:hypothetical protein
MEMFSLQQTRYRDVVSLLYMVQVPSDICSAHRAHRADNTKSVSLKPYSRPSQANPCMTYQYIYITLWLGFSYSSEQASICSC